MQLDVITYKNSDYEVFVRTTDDISYSWERFKSRVHNDAHKYCVYTSSDECELSLYDIDNHNLSTQNISTRWENLWPVVFETNAYQISIRFEKEIKNFNIVHIRKDIEACFYQEDNRLVGNVDFLNNPGVFRLEISYEKGEKKRHAWMTFEVVSPKLDTKRDYKSILRTVNEEYENVIYRYLSTTYQQFQKGKIRNDHTWMEAFQTVVDDYLRNVKRITQNPHFKTRTYEISRKADHIKRWTPQMEEAYVEAEAEGRLEEKYFTYNEYENTTNTFENRFVKYTLGQIGSRLEKILDKVLNNTLVSDNHRKEWELYKASLSKLKKHPFFKSVGRFEGMQHESLVLQSRLGYQQIYKDWLKLRRGIDMYDGATNIGTLQIWEIYELWCFIKMKHLVREVMGIDKNDPDYEKLVVEPKGSLLNPFTDSTLEHIVEFNYPDTDDVHNGGIVTLHYQHTFNRTQDDGYSVRTATTEQRPDIVLNIMKASGDILLTYLYDVKYRVVDDKKLDKDFEIADQEESENNNGGDYPPSDAINQMHRYRDAIYYGANKGVYESKEVIGGYILFPGRGDDNKISQRYYSKSIKSVNIGAFPLLPNEDEDKEGVLLKAHLKDILMDKRNSFGHVENAIPQRGRVYQAPVKILIAKVSSDVYNWCIGKNKYPIMVDDASINGLMQASYIFLTDGNVFKTKAIKIGQIECKQGSTLNLSVSYSQSFILFDPAKFYLLLKLEDDNSFKISDKKIEEYINKKNSVEVVDYETD